MIEVLAASANGVNSVFQTFGSALGVLVVVGGGFWKLRKWFQSDMENITKKHVGPVADSVKAVGSEMSLITATVGKHETVLYGDGGANKGALYDIAFLQGRDAGRSELAKTAQAVGQIVQGGGSAEGRGNP